MGVHLFTYMCVCVCVHVYIRSNNLIILTTMITHFCFIQRSNNGETQDTKFLCSMLKPVCTSFFYYEMVDSVSMNSPFSSFILFPSQGFVEN